MTLAHRLRRLALVAAALSAAGLARSPLHAASVPPDLHFRTITTPRAAVHFHQGLEPQARVAAALTAEILAGLEARYRTRIGRVQIVLADDSDEANGFTSIFPYPLIRLTVAAPDGTDELGRFESWLRLVLTHELAHSVDLEEARGLARVGRYVFGRAPFLFPNGAAASWMVEGLATYEETRGTAFGRGRDADARMILRMAALEGRFPREDQACWGLDLWPGGHAPYLFGEAFLRDLTARFGDQAVPDLARAHAAWPLPYLDEITSMVVTRAPFAQRWKEWTRTARAEFETEAAGLAAAGLTPSRALTGRGIRQVGARVSPDGAWIAYTSGSLTRQREIRTMAADGTQDRALTRRKGGLRLAWMPDGKSLVFDEPDFHHLYRYWSDLTIVDVATGRARRLTRGLRASDPDVAPDGRRIIFVRRTPTGSELAAVTRDGSFLGDLTRSAPGTLWSGPRVSPSGDAVVAARLTPGGAMDLVLVDLDGRGARGLTHDGAKNADPAWSPDGGYVVLRSDRDGVSNLYALRVSDGAVLRVSRVLGGAFAPSLDPSGTRLLFSGYSSRGYDVREMDIRFDDLEVAQPAPDRSPPPRPDPPADATPVTPYRPWGHLWPRYWMPYLGGSSTVTRIGISTSGFDPLLRHSYALTLHRTSETERFGFEGAYSYDRFRPTFLLAAKDVTDPVEGGLVRTRQAVASVSYPLHRSALLSHSLGLAWRGEEQRLEPLQAEGRRLRLSGAEVSWTLGSALQYPLTISPVDGTRLRLSAEQELPALGSDVRLLKLAADARFYLRLGERHALALRCGAATTRGERRLRAVYSLGGFPTGDLFDLLGMRPAVLRGYPDDAFAGRHLAYANAEYRFPLAFPERGLWSLPAFVRHLHGALFLDAGQAWTGRFAMDQFKAAAGASLGTDVTVGHVIPLTGVIGVARGLESHGRTRAYFQLGSAF